VTDVRLESARWPDYSATATRLGVAGVAGIPMRDGDQVIGALNIYSREPRQWSDQDIAVAVVLADVATSYVLNASKLHDQEQLSAQLQQALDSRVVIEQAKGITAHQNTVRVDQAYQLMRRHARKQQHQPACRRRGDRWRGPQGLSRAVMPDVHGSFPVAQGRSVQSGCPGDGSAPGSRRASRRASREAAVADFSSSSRASSRVIPELSAEGEDRRASSSLR